MTTGILRMGLDFGAAPAARRVTAQPEAIWKREQIQDGEAGHELGS